jgi:hypothetical protein
VPHHFNVNNNVAFDATSIFIAGRVTDNTGGFIQLTYSDIPNAFHVDNTDLRPYTTVFSAFGKDLRVGLSVNNNPTVQDPYIRPLPGGIPSSRRAWRPRRLQPRSWQAPLPRTRSVSPLIPGTTSTFIWKPADIRTWDRLYWQNSVRR